MLRVFLSCEQCFIIDDVDLNMLATMLEERANHAFDNAAAAFALHALGVEAQVEQRAFLQIGLVNRGNRLHRGRRSANIAAHHGARRITESFTRQAAIGQRASHFAMWDVHRLRVNAKRIMATACIGPALNLVGHIVHHFAINTIDMGRIVAVFFGLVEQQLAQALVAFEIRVAGGDEFIHRHVAVFKNALLNSGNAVGQIRRTRHIHAAGRNACSALLHRLAAFHAARRDHARKNHRVAIHVNRLHEVIANANLVIRMNDLLLQSVFELLDIGEFARVARAQAHELARARVDAIVQHELDHLAHVHVSRIGAAIGSAAARTRLNAADNGPIARVFKRAAFAKRHFHSGFVIEETRVGLAFLNHFAPEVDKFVRRGVAYAQCHDGLRGLQIVGRLQAQKRQIVARIASVALHAAHHENLPHGIARERRGVPRIAHLIHLARLQIQAFDELERLIARKNTFVDNVFFVERPHILVETPKTACRGADLNMEHHVHEPHHLHRLGKGLRWVFGDDAAILGNAAQLGSAGLVGARRSLALRLVGHAMRIRHKTLRLDNARAPEIDLRSIFLGLRHARINVALAFLDISAHTDTQHFFMVARCLARHAILQANAQNVVGLKLLNIFGHHRIRNIFHRFALPIRQSF